MDLKAELKDWDKAFPAELWATMPNGTNRVEVATHYCEVARTIADYIDPELTTEENLTRLREDCVSEIADSLIPVYTGDKWQEFSEMKLWNSNDLDEEAAEIFSFAAEKAEGMDRLMEACVDAYLFTFYSFTAEEIFSWLELKAAATEDLIEA